MIKTATANEAYLRSLSITSLPGVGEKSKTLLAKIGINTVMDVLLHLPKRYIDKTKITPIATCKHGDSCQIQGEIVSNKIINAKRRSLIVEVTDYSSLLQFRFFNFSKQQKANLIVGKIVRAFGEVKVFKNQLNMIHPEYKLIDKEDYPLASSLQPIYPLTEGIGQASMQKIAKAALAILQKYPLIEWLDEEFLAKYQIPNINESIFLLHNPSLTKIEEQFSEPILKDEVQDKIVRRSAGNNKLNAHFENNFNTTNRFSHSFSYHPAQVRLMLDELVAHQLSSKLANAQSDKKAISLQIKNPLKKTLITNLPFTLTNAQLKVIEEIGKDIAKNTPMTRLLQGDVGSGKTLVAITVALAAINSNAQTVIMVPTEILAEQHVTVIKNILTPLKITPYCLNGNLSSSEKNLILEKIASGEALLIIGTHAVIQEAVTFKNLALCIIDEQHRFGVAQRLALLNKNNNYQPHLLLMTATPIPRTLAMTAFAKFSCSVIDELPKGRTPIVTSAISQNRREEIINKLKQQKNIGRQTYWVCTLIDESENLAAKDASQTKAYLEQILTDFKIGLVHGKMKSCEKEKTMTDFKNGKIDLLVATTVIEVGVDVPNASLMIIENPERLGLAQLHQLRGRVGRGRQQSHCILLYKSPLSEQAKYRINMMRQSNSGFELADADLKLRGPGQWLGIQQSGSMEFKIVDINSCQKWLQVAHELADKIIYDPYRTKNIIARWLHNKQIYSNV